MDMEVFARKICAVVEKELGREFRAEAREVRKNNGILLHGLSIWNVSWRLMNPACHSKRSWEGCCRPIGSQAPKEASTWDSSNRLRMCGTGYATG